METHLEGTGGDISSLAGWTYCTQDRGAEGPWEDCAAPAQACSEPSLLRSRLLPCALPCSLSLPRTAHASPPQRLARFLPCSLPRSLSLPPTAHAKPPQRLHSLPPLLPPSLLLPPTDRSLVGVGVQGRMGVQGLVPLFWHPTRAVAGRVAGTSGTDSGSLICRFRRLHSGLTRNQQTPEPEPATQAGPPVPAALIWRRTIAHVMETVPYHLDALLDPDRSLHCRGALAHSARARAPSFSPSVAG